ncbi:MAG: lytic transglycosylase domain-containing protein [Acidobacteria bacterium]|nr:lytic transglycosylase domain-containing protein [Acidobacteriota bacterium]
MVLKWGLILCGAAAMLALAWAPVAYVVNGNGRTARERVESIVDRAARAPVMPAFQGGGEGFLEARPVPARLTEPVGQGASSPAGGSRDEASPAERSATPERPYDRLVEQAAARHGVDPGLVHALIEVESGYRADAVSSVGAMGLMQLMPRTARRYGVSDPLDPAANIDAGTQHLRALLDEFGPLYELSALAAYNAGEVVVRRHGGIPPYPQTQRFVRRVLEVLLSQRGRGGGD